MYALKTTYIYIYSGKERYKIQISIINNNVTNGLSSRLNSIGNLGNGLKPLFINILLIYMSLYILIKVVSPY